MPLDPRAVHPEGKLCLAPDLSDDAGHRHACDGLRLRQLGQAVLVREHDSVHFAILERCKVLPCALDDVLHALFVLVPGVAGQGFRVTRGDDRLLNAEHVLRLTHKCSLSVCIHRSLDAAEVENGGSGVGATEIAWRHGASPWRFHFH